MKYYIRTYGCQMNVHDSEKIAGIFSESGMDQAPGLSSADVIVLNSCSIREKAEQKFFSELGRLKKVKNINPHLKIAVAGCIAQQEGDKLFKRYPYVDFVFGPNNIDGLHAWIKSSNGTQRAMIDGHRMTSLEMNPDYHRKILPVKREGRVRAWVAIMYGCNNFCAYCVVPYTRGREKSRASDDICREIEKLATEGYKEVTLLGQNVNSYGKNLDEHIDFPDLLRKINDIQGIKRIRFITSHPRDFSKKLIMAMSELEKVCEHIHLPLQSGSDTILKNMKREYTLYEYKQKIELLREKIPDASITTDIITGFPGETEGKFELTMKALSEIKFDGIFAFKYSKRPRTAALDLHDHVDEATKSQRLAEILNLQEKITYKKNKDLEGEITRILVEGVSETDPEKMTGRTGTNKIVNYYGNETDVGSLLRIKIVEAKQHSLYGEKVP